MAYTKNPFEVLGIHPSIVKNLSDKDVLDLAHTMYRRLQVIYHPDKTGSDDASLQLNEAWELLQVPEDFAHEKKRFLRPKPYQGKAEELEKELTNTQEAASQLNQHYQQQMIEYISALTNPQNTVVNATSKRFSLFDTARDLNALNDFASKLSRNKNYWFEMEIDEHGLITTTHNKKSQQHPNKTLIGTISVEYIRHTLNTTIGDLLRKAKFFWNELDDNTDEIRSELSGTRTSSDYGHRVQFENQLTQNEFNTIIPYLTPALEKYSYLFSINLEDNEPYFSIEGRVSSVEDIE